MSAHPDHGRPGSGASPVLQFGSRPDPLSEWLGRLWSSRSLLASLASKEFRVRYKRAALGILWSVALPIFQSAVMVFIFSRIGHFGSGAHFNYAAYVLAGMVPWLYLSTSVASATTSIVDASDITEKIFFPRAVLPLVSPTANLFTLAISIIILVVALPIVGSPLEPRLLLVIPATVLLCAFTAGLGLVYPPSALKGAGPWLDFNPFTGIVGLFQRAAVGAPVPSARALIVSVVATTVIAILAVIGHRRHDRLFVDLL
jgi:ABC-type polysaccharide/polyol phosphate export permease